MTYDENDWKPGDVAMATAPNGTEFMVVRTGSGHGYWSAPNDWPSGVTSEYECDYRRLVVIDPKDHEWFTDALNASLDFPSGSLLGDAVGAAVADALREFASPTPPKPRREGPVVEFRDERTGRQYFVAATNLRAFEAAGTDLERTKIAHVVIDNYGVAKNRGGK